MIKKNLNEKYNNKDEEDFNYVDDNFKYHIQLDNSIVYDPRIPILIDKDRYLRLNSYYIDTNEANYINNQMVYSSPMPSPNQLSFVPLDMNFKIAKRISCHKCGNIRKSSYLCPNRSCPHIFCLKCVEKSKLEYGNNTFINGCPVCLQSCCCSNKSSSCKYQYHCYRKCPMSKIKFTKPESEKLYVDMSSKTTSESSSLDPEDNNTRQISVTQSNEEESAIIAAEALCNLFAKLPKTEEENSKEELKTYHSKEEIEKDHDLNYFDNNMKINSKSNLYVTTSSIDAFVQSSFQDNHSYYKLGDSNQYKRMKKF